ncbi:pseudouridine synthase [Corynebacterium sp. HS2168-gen11]|uniref:pseudouridine synthase n=1 Tax=Corynebacterium sp. HS2168-gen11 TaxID=2974027 RepID=UPI00216B2075|nr:pseudouridine synthase [Corynebacterium sp. HS2168-gen11]MCS4536477.1 pseudouridine synthase [Corynebacterium sp. HS2168-gen11]
MTSQKAPASYPPQRKTLIPRRTPPLPVRDGLNPTRARIDETTAGMSAFDFVWLLKTTQRYVHPADTQANLHAEFQAGNVRRGLAPQDQRLDPTSILKLGDDVWFYRMPAEEVEVPYTWSVVHEDDDLLVVDKPPFMATMPRGRHITQTLTVQLRRATGIAELSPAHRLDRLTAGVLLLTKRAAIRGAYQELFAQRLAEKTYEAIADQSAIAPGTQWQSRLEKIAGQVQGEILEGEPNAHTTVVDVQACTPEEMSLLKKLHGDIPPQSHYILQPHTGKTHQLRLHMWSAGIPILGDPAYPTVLPEQYEDFTTPMHLIARKLSFVDPLSGQPREFQSTRTIASYSMIETAE